MWVLRDSSSFPLSCRDNVVALGNFDGLHKGHCAVIGKAIKRAKQAGKPAGVITFEPHPRRIFSPHLSTLRILPLSQKLRLLQNMGLDFVRIVRFTSEFAKTSAEDFVVSILKNELHASHVITGEDFVFGHNREGSVESLRTMAEKLNFGATACHAVIVEGERCSSTRVRAALAAGNMETVVNLLGRPYILSGHVQEGDKRGRTLGFPTANILPPPGFLPHYGVYAVKVSIGKNIINGVANLGMRPTFGGHRVRLEAHLFDWQEDIYGQYLEVELIRHIRGEQKFDSVEALKIQIAQDCGIARKILE